MGYDTLVGEMGSTLSGGQRQRVLLARALYREPKILILDEGTSHLDVVLEQAVSSAISRMSMTRIIIAHRVETIIQADSVFEVKSGALADVSRRYDAVRKQLSMIAGRPPDPSPPEPR
jgi:ATP-binding cassette subfamily B protein RaxB